MARPYKKIGIKEYEDAIAVLHGGLKAYVASINTLLDLTTFQGKPEILELCCGTGLATREIYKRTRSPHTIMDQDMTFLTHTNDTVFKKHFNGFWNCDIARIAMDKDNDRRYDIVVMCNAATELLVEDINLYAVATNCCKTGGQFLCNIKISDGKESAYARLSRILTKHHRKHFPQRPWEFSDALVIPAAATRDMVEEGFAQHGFHIENAMQYEFSLDMGALDRYFANVMQRYHRRLLDAEGGTLGGTLDEWLEREIRAWSGDVLHEWLKAGYSQHTKTELLICARKIR